MYIYMLNMFPVPTFYNFLCMYLYITADKLCQVNDLEDFEFSVPDDCKQFEAKYDELQEFISIVSAR